jgi:Flp pilus assembly protein TadB
MSESDYQRGLRGGPADVSISDYQRWRDWKAGHDAYERALDDADEERYLAILSPEERIARINARMKERESERVAADQRHRQLRQEARRRADDDALKGVFVGVCLVLAVCWVVGVVVGVLLQAILRLPFIITFLAATGIAWWRIQVEVIDEYRRAREKRRREAAADQ